MRSLLLTVALSVGLATPSAAQAVKVAFHDGLVSVDATSAPVRSILTEWGKVGGTNVVGVERLVGAPLTVKLVNVTEAQALETILRGVSGYMAAPRKTSVGASRYDRILVMATSAAPAAANVARPAGAPGNGAARLVVPPRQRQEQSEPEEQDEPDENPPNPPVFTFPQPGQNGGMNGQSQPGTQTITINPSQPMAPGGVSTPGMIVPAPAVPVTQPGTQPVQMIRPPGGQ